MTELWAMTAVELLAGYRSKMFSPLEVTKSVLARIEQANPQLNAFVLVKADEALAAAAASETRWQKGEPGGLLDGVPVSIKDLLITKGWPTLRGSRTVDPAGPWEADAPSVARLREQDAVLLGKTATPEFGWKGVTDSPLSGITRNPWDTNKTPGGSSGGTAAALAAGMGPIGLGTDGGGSIRIPAAFSGVFGLKPSFGRVPASPQSPFGTLAQTGPMTRSVEDAALILNVISLPDARDSAALPYDARDYRVGLNDGVRGLRIAYSANLGYASVEPEVASIVRNAAAVFAELGAIVEEQDPGFDDVAPIFGPLWQAGAAYVYRGLTPEQRELVDPGFRSLALKSEHLSLASYQDAVMQRGGLTEAMNRFHEDFDLLLTPALPLPAFEAGQEVADVIRERSWTDWTPFSYPFNLTQQPAASIPCGFTGARLPVGLQIVGPRYGDALVLRAARAFESGRRIEWLKEG